MKLPHETPWGTTALDAAKRAGGLIVAFAIVLAIFLAVFFAAAWFGELITYEATFEWWLAAYFIVGAILACLTALVAFFGIWYLAAQEWGALAFIMGWLPSGILAFVAWWLVLALWGPALIVSFGVNAYRTRAP